MKCSMKYFLLMIGLFICSCSIGQAAPITTLTFGAWNNPAIWSTGTTPGNGDTVVINHLVTLTGAQIVGTSGSSGGAAAIAIGSAGGLTLAMNSSLVVRGDITLNNSQVELNPGAVIEFDLNTAPVSTAYALRIGTGHNQSNARLVSNCLPSNRCIVRTRAGVNIINARITGDEYLMGGQISATYTDFERIGDSIRPAIAHYTTGNAIFSLTEVRMVDGGMISGPYALGADASFSLSSVTFQGTKSDACLDVNGYNPLSASGVRYIYGSVFDKLVRLYPGQDFDIQNNYFHDAFEVTEGKWKRFSNNFVRSQGYGTLLAGDAIDNYWYVENGATGFINSHFVQTASFNFPMVLDGNIFEYNGTDGEGDAILIGIRPVLTTITGSIALPNLAGENSGTLFSALGESGSTVIADHNTFFAGTQAATIGETYVGHAGLLKSFRSNLAWDTAPRGYKLRDSGVNDNVPNLVSAFMADYNLGFNLLPGTNGTGYTGLEFSSGTPGVNDLNVNPYFVDPKRNLARWDALNGGPGTANHAMTQLRKRNDSDYQSLYTIQGLIASIKEGYRPTNEEMRGMAHDSNSRGAWVVPGAVPMSRELQSATATPTMTILPTTAITATRTPVLTATASATGTPTAVISRTPVLAPSSTPTVVPTKSPVVKATRKPRRTRIKTPTRTPTPECTSTPTRVNPVPVSIP